MFFAYSFEMRPTNGTRLTLPRGLTLRVRTRGDLIFRVLVSLRKKEVSRWRWRGEGVMCGLVLGEGGREKGGWKVMRRKRKKWRREQCLMLASKWVTLVTATTFVQVLRVNGYLKSAYAGCMTGNGCEDTARLELYSRTSDLQIAISPQRGGAPTCEQREIHLQVTLITLDLNLDGIGAFQDMVCCQRADIADILWLAFGGPLKHPNNTPCRASKLRDGRRHEKTRQGHARDAGGVPWLPLRFGHVEGGRSDVVTVCGLSRKLKVLSCCRIHRAT
ncbi:unnamed protein product [Cercospora beticola]|nr:unnamed protein product [Cercospora beticola]